MSIFAEILSKQLPNIEFPSVNAASINNLQLSLNYNSLHHVGVSLLYYIYYLPFAAKPIQNNKKIFANKFDILNTFVITNDTITQHEKNYFFTKFTSTQKTYNSFRRLAHICKHKYCKKFGITTDLCFTEFSNFKSNMLITLLENNISYTFRIADLVNIINKSLTHSSHFFADPQEIKNPYTNLPFTLHNLYNIYFKLKSSNYIVPILFEMFFISGFTLNKFKNHNECYIRDRCIDNFIKNASVDEQYEQIMKMFYVHNSSIYFKIDPYFPRNKLAKIFKRYLHSFLLEEYSLNPHVREANRIHLEYNLTIFSQLNPDFGKRIWIRKRRTSQITNTFTFYDSVIDTDDLIQSRFVDVGRYLATPSPRVPVQTQALEQQAEMQQDRVSHAESEEESTPIAPAEALAMDDDDEIHDTFDDDDERQVDYTIDDDDVDDAADESEAEEYEAEAEAEPQPVMLSSRARSYLANRNLMPDYSEEVDNIDTSNRYPLTTAYLNAIIDVSNNNPLRPRPSIFRNQYI